MNTTEPKCFHYFYEISKIPRPTYHEEKIADYVEQFAKDRGLWYQRDALHNIIIKKPGSTGRENEAPLILQAHMDMVCVKTAESTHDFSMDPIEIMEVDGWFRANGTTLGADDGAGVAYMLALLDEPELSNPPLECIFTVQEEDGMGGAKTIDLSEVHGKRMIGLDGNYEGTTVYTAAAVRACKYHMDLKMEEAHGNRCVLNVTGLTSGHGAMLIGSQRANSIKTVARLLRTVQRSAPIQLKSMQGGGLLHVIPRDCKVKFYSDLNTEELLEILQPVMEQVKLEYAVSDPNMEITIEATALDQSVAVTEADSERVLRFLHVLPAGASLRHAEDLPRVLGSFNLSILKLDGAAMECHLVCRANYPFDVMENRAIAQEYAELFGASCESTQEYAGHYVPLDTPLTRVWSDVYKENTGKDLGLLAVHVGLDAGTIFERQKLEDLVVIMPDTWQVHTTEERMNIDGYRRTYEYVKQILARI